MVQEEHRVRLCLAIGEEQALIDAVGDDFVDSASELLRHRPLDEA